MGLSALLSMKKTNSSETETVYGGGTRVAMKGTAPPARQASTEPGLRG